MGCFVAHKIKSTMIFDLKKLILRFNGCKIPIETIERLDGKVMNHWYLVNYHMKAVWDGLCWTRTNCNRLVIGCLWNCETSKKEVMYCRYLSVTGMTPTRKRAVEAVRKNRFVPIWPGDRHYPTSRVGFSAKYNINDRYFR